MDWLWWIGAALILGVIETLTADLTFLMFASGALGGALTAALGGPFWLQVVVFAIVSTLLLLLVRPWAKRHIQATTPQMQTNAPALVGRQAVTLTVVDAQGGRVRLGGEEWSARLAERGQVPNDVVLPSSLATGTSVEVVAIDGAIAVVVPLSSSRSTPRECCQS